MTDRWSARFLSLLEALRMPAEFQAGRRYVRRGQVRSLTIGPSLASATVRDDDGEMQRARIAVRALTAGDWHRVERALADEPIHAAKLLAGEVPTDLDALFDRLGLSLFPDSLADLAMDCTCPDPRTPCRHLTATCYAMAETFDRDAFAVLAWRGRGREELLEGLRSRYLAPAVPVAAPPLGAPPEAGDFWTAGPRVPPPPPPVAGTVRRPDALLEQLDPLRLSVGRFDVVDLLRPVYRQLSHD